MYFISTLLQPKKTLSPFQPLQGMLQDMVCKSRDLTRTFL